MTLIVGAKCLDGVLLAADRRRLAHYEKGPETTKLFNLSCGMVLAGAGDDAVLNEARILIEHRAEQTMRQSKNVVLWDLAGITIGVVNELVGIYRDKIEESFGFAIAGLENIHSGRAKLYTIFGAGLSEVPWTCIGLGSPYVRPLVDLLLADGNLNAQDTAKVVPYLYTLVSSVQTSVGGGVDICVIRDGKDRCNIVYKGEVDLARFRKAILGTIVQEV